MESVFVGRHEHSLDAKGRIVLPAGFRGAFEPSGFLIKHSEGCLALMTPDRFGEIAAQMSERSHSGRALWTCRQALIRRGGGTGPA